jgi:hypothetical protein
MIEIPDIAVGTGGYAEAAALPGKTDPELMKF